MEYLGCRKAGWGGGDGGAWYVVVVVANMYENVKARFV